MRTFASLIIAASFCFTPGVHAANEGWVLFSVREGPSSIRYLQGWQNFGPSPEGLAECQRHAVEHAERWVGEQLDEATWRLWPARSFYCRLVPNADMRASAPQRRIDKQPWTAQQSTLLEIQKTVEELKLLCE